MLHLKLSALVVVVWVACQGPHLLADGLESQKFMPDQVHCSATLFLANKEPRKEPNFFVVDEYVDKVSNRSSLSVYDRVSDDNQIYYNQVGPKEKYADRKFVNYDTATNTCQAKRIGFWPLAILRKVAILVYPETSELKNIDVDVAVGPSVLLYAIDDNSKHFRYKTTVLSKSRLTDVDVYSNKVDVITAEDYDQLELIVHVVRRGREGAKVGETLAESVAIHRHVEVASLVACKIKNKKSEDDEDDDDEYGNEDDDDAPDNSAPKRPDSTDSIDDDFDDFGCKYQDILFQIEYDFVNVYSVESGSSLIGRKLDEQGEYDFHREPFVQPIGIGCWDIGGQHEWEPKFSPSSRQFSAEFITTNGSKGVSFVAFDGYTNTLRLDRFGRKNIYDLLAKKSYHIGQFSAARESNQADLSMERCITLDTLDYVNEFGIMSRLLGFGDGRFPQHHLGSKTIDHIVYEVFESTVSYMTTFGNNFPILFGPNRYSAEPDFLKKNKYFLTYYVRVYPGVNLNLRAENTTTTTTGAPKMMIPAYAELWEYNKESNRRTLINRLTYVEFSWSLDVEPVNDPDTQKTSNGLFDIQQCHRERSNQADLMFNINRSPFGGLTFTEEHRTVLSSNKFYLNEIVSEKVASTLGLSRLNLAKLDSRIKKDGTIIVKARIADLIVGISHEQSLGTARFYADPEVWYTNILQLFTNRHTINDCRLDSIALPEPNWLAYCPGLTMCVLLRRNENIKSKLKTIETSDSDRVQDLCEIRLFEWFDYKDAMNEQGAVHLADSNRFKIGGAKFTFLFPGGGGYLGYGAGVQLQKLDPLGAKVALRAPKSTSDNPLAGLRYSTMREHPEVHNMNRRVRLSDSLDTFKHCQLACQMDDMCASFSVCLRKKNKKNKDNQKGDECILSTVRLSAERLDRLVSMSAKRRKSDKFEAKMSSLTESQSLMMYHDDSDCSLHPKDLLLEFSIKKTITMVDEPQNSTVNGQTEKTTKQEVVTLEECAGRSHELNLFNDPMDCKFTYCPIDSSCLLGEQSQGKHLLASTTKLTKFCFVYKKNFRRFYDSTLMSHLVVTLPSPPLTPPETTDGSLPDEKQDKKGTHLDLVREMERFELARSFWGLNEESCARDCNLHQSNCLAFDTCRNLGVELDRTLCILFTIRSPLSSSAANLPLLPREQQLRDAKNGSASITSSIFCNHHRLKPGYFNVRLRQMFAELESTGDSEAPGEGPFKPSELRDKIDSLEDKILEEDRRLSDQAKGEISKQTSGDGDHGYESATRQTNTGVHWLALLAGLAAGAVGVLYGKQTVAAATQLYQKHQASRAHANEGLAQLILNDTL